MATLDALLAGLAHERSTGALRVGRAGTVYLDEGRVTYMESAHTPGVERILAVRGRVTEAALRRIAADGGSERLLAEGPVTLGELQFCVLGAVMDAAFFLLPTGGTRPKFRPGERHWLGGCWYFDVAGLVRECARRRAHLAQVWPSADVDAAPVRPVPRMPGDSVTLTKVQWELLARADQEATPLELARRLGRSAYSVLLGVRTLAAAGLLVPVEPDDDARRAAALPKRGQGRTPPEGRPPYQDTRPATGAKANGLPFGPAVTADPSDIALLMRLKKALEELA
jgi:hypothetical protein